MRLSRRAKENIAGYAFIFPSFCGFIGFVFIPVLFSLFISFTDWDIFTKLDEVKMVGLDNFIRMFSDSWFISSIRNNLFFVVIIPLQILLALITAVLLNGEVAGKIFLRVSMYLPYITSFVIITIIWRIILRPDEGFVNAILHNLGVRNPPGWFASSFWVKPSIALMLTWNNLGYYAILYLSGLQTIDKSLYESSHMDGAGKIKQFYHITLPMISPVTFFIAIMSIIGAFKMWTTIQLVTDGGPGDASTVVAFYVYKTAFIYLKMGYASAMAWVLLIVVFIITLIQWRGQKKWVNY